VLVQRGGEHVLAAAVARYLVTRRETLDKAAQQ